MRTLLAPVIVAFVVPGIALAAKPPAPGTPQSIHGKAAPRVLYILKGTLNAYTAADASTDGSVSITVAHANRHGAALEKLTLVFPVSPGTRVVLPTAGFTAGDKGVVKVRGPKKIGPTADLATVLTALTAKQVVDQGHLTS